MPGLPKKPPELRQGKPRGPQPKDVALRDEAPPVPLPPRGLLARTRQRWRDYWASPVARAVDPVADLHRVERWIRAVDEYERCYPTFVRARLTEGSMKQTSMNPLAGYLHQLEGTIARAETELGLTPMARLRLGIAYGQARLTAAELNQALQQGDDGTGDEVLDAEWREA
jgi:P27 family predicted phage terminase small subunit